MKRSTKEYIVSAVFSAVAVLVSSMAEKHGNEEQWEEKFKEIQKKKTN